MSWLFPLAEYEHELPKPPHPGAFGVERKHHHHEGVDLYCPYGTPVRAVEDGKVVAVEPFTGPMAGSPWWLDTMCVMVEGDSGVVCYGEIEPDRDMEVGVEVPAGRRIGEVRRVLRKDKGRPTSMLHFELYRSGVVEPVDWPAGTVWPDGLLDPTKLLEAALRPHKSDEIDRLLEVLERADAAVVAAQRAVVAAQRTAGSIRHQITQALATLLDMDPISVELGSWDCEHSPTGKCVYDLHSDMGDDECLYCGEPDERK
jgi:hypothetical protein